MVKNKVNLNDTELVNLYRSGYEWAFEVLLKRHKSKVYTTIYLIVKDRYIAEDLLQETFIKVINTIHDGKYNEEGKFIQWVSRMAHNMAIDYIRKEQRNPCFTMEDDLSSINSLHFAEHSTENNQIRTETLEELKNCIAQLPEKQREVLIMRHYMNMSFQEIADATGVGINTALGRMRYALLGLKKQLSQSPIAYDKNVYS